MRLGAAVWLRPLATLALIVVLWAGAIWAFRIPAFEVPQPGAVALALVSDAPTLLRAAVPTIEATLLGFVLSALFGVSTAAVMSTSRIADAYVYPLLVFSQSIPKVAVAPLFVVWFGFGILPRVITA
ncbi:MAG TPA: ABC transporter permease, partial [Beijerinckiaceae bacterium]|nr:ABC transporter permease [Beijerinckiaceae bacterium]